MSHTIEQRPSPVCRVGRPRRMRTFLFLGRLRLKGWLLRTIRSGPFWKKLLGDRSQEKFG